MSNKIVYPSEWDDLPKKERKKKLRSLKKELENKKKKLDALSKKIVVGITIFTLIGLIYFWQKIPKTVRLGEEFSIEGRDHVESTQEFEYQTNPPTSGDHLAEATKWGVYENEVEDGGAVHALEHGGIWITYKDINTEETEILTKIANKNKNSVVLSPRLGNDEKISVAAWGRLMNPQGIDEEKITTFIKQNINRSPEKLAR